MMTRHRFTFRVWMSRKSTAGKWVKRCFVLVTNCSQNEFFAMILCPWPKVHTRACHLSQRLPVKFRPNWFRFAGVISKKWFGTTAICGIQLVNHTLPSTPFNICGTGCWSLNFSFVLCNMTTWTVQSWMLPVTNACISTAVSHLCRIVFVLSMFTTKSFGAVHVLCVVGNECLQLMSLTPNIWGRVVKCTAAVQVSCTKLVLNAGQNSEDFEVFFAVRWITASLQVMMKS